MAKAKAKATNVSEGTNDAEFHIESTAPYIAKVEITGASDILFHRWSNEDVAEKANAAKNSKAKKTDNIESYLYRNDKGVICLPGEYLRQSIIHSAKFRQDPRSPRKSAMDLFKAGVVSLTDLAPIGKDKPDYEDSRRVRIGPAGITRVRPAFRAGWKATFDIQVIAPEYIDPQLLLDVIANAGRLIGVGDFRPTYGRFNVTGFKVV